jgi:diacylglycerol kinase (ATP)
MRAAAILGPGSSERDLKLFQCEPRISWTLGLPAAGDADVVLIFGGDGTVHRHLGALVKLGLPILVIPQGSGNDFARALRIVGVRDAFKAWRQFGSGPDRAKAVDLGVITPLESEVPQKTAVVTATAEHDPQRYFCCVAGVGLDAAVVERTNRLPRWLRSHGGYALSLPAALLGFEAAHITISEQKCDQRSDVRPQYSDRALLAAFANTPVFGGGMRIAPRALMDDGQLDICVVGDISKLKLLSVFPTVYAGRHLGIRQVEYFQAECVRVETEVPLDVYADGEYVCQTPVEIKIAAGALRVVTPG